MTVRLDNVRIRVEAVDLDGDGVTGGIEKVQQRGMVGGEREILQPTELGEVMSSMNEDVIEPHTRMSSIDMKSRLHWVEVNGILGMDALVGFKVLPRSCLAFTRQKKRLNVSIDGRGRQELVDCVVGKRDHDATMGMGGGGLADRIKGFFKKGDDGG